MDRFAYVTGDPATEWTPMTSMTAHVLCGRFTSIILVEKTAPLRYPIPIEKLDKDAAEIANKVVEQIESVDLLASAIGGAAQAKAEVKRK